MKLKVAIGCNQFDNRGSGKVPCDYGIYLQKYLNADILFVTSKQSINEGLPRIQSKFKTILYDTKPIHHQNFQEQQHTKLLLENIVEKEKIDFFHFLKSGENDNIDPRNCKTGVQGIFRLDQPHGSVYCGVSEYLAKKYNKVDFIPHIITYTSPTENFRKKFNIPKDSFVFGRHGGNGHFNIPFAHDAIKTVLDHRKDVYFLFLSTDVFYKHERIIHIPWVESQQEIFNFISACDCMIHSRIDGETFGLACAEFSVSNKPIITWSGLLDGHIYPGYDKCHIELLEDRAILYNNYQDLLDTLFSIDKQFISQYDWDKYSIKFSPQKVIEQYKSIFLKNFYE